jgi:predicted DNA-binding protein
MPWVNGIDSIAIMTYNTYKHSINRGLVVPDAIKKTRYFLDIDPELRNRLKAVAALRGKTMKDWLTEAIITKLEDEIDASDGLASLADTKGTMSLEAYLASRQGEPTRTE